MQIKGDPSFTLGQGALGGVSNLNQRKLNIMYSGSAKPKLVKTELIKILSYMQGENMKVLVLKLGKIYTLLQFSITVFDDKTSHREYSFKSNGNCLPAANSQLSGYGKSIIVCWIRKGSFNVQANKQKSRKL